MIPWSWALQHLALMLDGPMTNECTFWESERILLLEAIRKTVFTLCQVVEKIDPEITSHGLSFTGMGRNNLHNVMVKRRIFDCLTTVYLNLASYPEEPRGLASMWPKMQKVSSLVACHQVHR